MLAVTLLHTAPPTFGCGSNRDDGLTWPVMTAANINAISDFSLRQGLKEIFAVLGCYVA